MKRILVTGGSGRIGKYLLPAFAKEYELKVFDMVEPEQGGYDFVRGNITMIDDLVKAVQDVDGIVHLAAIPVYTGEDEKIMKINVDGTFNVLEAAERNGVQNIVFASSVCVWGVINWSTRITPSYFPVDEQILDKADDMYGMGKLIGEHLCYVYSHRYGLKCICLRLSTVGFPDADYWIEARKNIENPEYRFTKSGKSLIDFCWQYVDVRDLPHAFLLALKALDENKTSYEIYNIGATDVFSTVESLELIRRYYPEVKYIRNETDFLKDPYRALFDISKAQKELGYNPQYTWRDFNP